MTGFQILFGRPEQARAGRTSKGVLDLVVDGMNLTARVGESHIPPFLRDLTYAVVDLATGRRGRVTVPFYLYDDPWELGLLREGTGVLLTVFRGGPFAEVAVYERFLQGDALLANLARALDERLARRSSDQEHADLECARSVLQTVGSWERGYELNPVWHTIPMPGEGMLALGCELLLRPPSPDEPPSSVARTDLLPLLVRGKLRLRAGRAERELGDCFVFLVVERLVDVAEQCLTAAERGQRMQLRFEAGRISGSILQEEDGALRISLRQAQGATHGEGEFLVTEARSLALAVTDLGRNLARLLVRQDRSQGQNLRLDAFRASIRRLQERLRPRQELSSRLNHAPESYRAYALAAHRKQGSEGTGLAQGKLRFVARWEATVPGIDLTSTFLCGDRLLVTGSRELAALGRNTGDVLWTRPVQRAVAIPTPGGLARLRPDGQLDLHDYGNGEVTLSLRLVPRLGGPSSGTVIHAPGLPKLLVVTEGERHLSALDLVSGEIRWRYTLPRAGTTRLRRAGKLLLEVSGDQLLTALDVQSGEIVWRRCTSAPCHQAPSFDHDVLFQVASDGGGHRGRPRLYAIDAWTGAVRFEVPLPSRPTCHGAPLLTADTAAILTRDERGTGLMAFDRGTGALRYQLPPGLTPHGASWLAVDDCLFANTDQGELLGIEAVTGAERFRLQLSPPSEDGGPRRLDPVLRSGALFVPQQEVFVIRPRDGELLGKVPSEIIPDLLRVDERCDVYLGEESGLLAAFGAGPRLSLVKS
ncbi:MAG: PQQ-binding-like beta-propeller repeat protein [Myxococcales bacterium]|nr:PQQ-like beta-propeller repeat protein [Polyangiaceae bacterium]MDW8251684.1 PQQ-binding-like beta-propeller repeat protein [Myxococcales bacterium]